MIGIRTQQAEGIAVGAFASHLSPAEKGTSDLERICREQGLKASSICATIRSKNDLIPRARALEHVAGIAGRGSLIVRDLHVK